MKRIIYILMLLLILPIVCAEEVAELDFRVLVSEDDTIIPVLIDINNLKGEEYEAKLGISMMDYEFNPGSEIVKDVTIEVDQKLIYLDLLIEPEEKQYNIFVYLIPEEGMPVFLEYNSIMRFDSDFLENDYELIPSPVEELRKEAVKLIEEIGDKYEGLDENEIEEALQRDYPEYFEENKSFPWFTTILVIMVLFISIIIIKIKFK